MGPYFASPCPAQARNSRVPAARLTRLERRTKTPYQMLLIKRLTKVTNDPMVQGAGVVNVVGVGSNEDRGNRVTSMRCNVRPPLLTSNAVPWNSSLGQIASCDARN